MRPVIACLLALALAACDSKPQSGPQGGVPAESVGRVDISQRGKEMPAIPFAAPGGGPATLTQFRGKPLMVQDRAAFVRDFEKIFPAKVISAILAIDPRILFANSQGFSIGRGSV